MIERRRHAEAARYAVYWTPEPEHPLWEVGCRWLGRDPRQGPARDDPESIAARRRFLGDRGPWVDGPARYGFHATLKAPMHLSPDRPLDAFLDAVAALARRHTVFALPALQVAWLDGFVALRPVAASSLSEGELCRLADDAVVSLDPFRGEASESEHARLRRLSDPGLRALAQRWGYPYVLDRWRFHLTLSNPFVDVASREARALYEAAFQAFDAALQRPVNCASVCVFRESAPGAPLMLIERMHLSAARPER